MNLDLKGMEVPWSRNNAYLTPQRGPLCSVHFHLSCPDRASDRTASKKHQMKQTNCKRHQVSRVILLPARLPLRLIVCDTRINKTDDFRIASANGFEKSRFINMTTIQKKKLNTIDRIVTT
jgi:hypothetical protein